MTTFDPNGGYDIIPLEPEPDMSTVGEVAQWMLEETLLVGLLGRSDAVEQIRARFHQVFVWEGQQGWRVSRHVTDQLERLAGDRIVWDARQMAWRRREQRDERGWVQ